MENLNFKSFCFFLDKIGFYDFLIKKMSLRCTFYVQLIDILSTKVESKVKER